MNSDIAYRIYLTDEYGERIYVGDLIATGKECAFRYHESFWKSKGRFSIDPINLPIEKTAAREKHILFGVFKDSLPDGWGLTLMAKRFDLPIKEQSPHLLLQYLDHQSIGALSYENITGKKRLSVQEETIKTVGELAEAARLFETGELQDSVLLNRLFNSAGSTGGAHPKANVTGEYGLYKIVKFPSAKDTFDVVGLEASCLELARMSGMRVPDFEIIEAGNRKALCLDRFDRTDEGCRHMISMQTLLKAANEYYHATYVQMADVLRSVSSNPAVDLHALFRQMIFNAVVGNTDDHLKNFSMYYCDKGYELTPAYDLLPDVNQKSAHTLSFVNNDVPPRRSEAIDTLADRFKIDSSSAAEIVDEVVDIVSANWHGVCAQNEVPQKDIDHFYSHIKRQADKLAKPTT